MSTPLTALLDVLCLQFGERVLTSEIAREQHGSGESHLPPAWPDAVVLVKSTKEVSDVLAACTQYGVPAIPFGAGSSIEGKFTHRMAGSASTYRQWTRLSRLRQTIWIAPFNAA